MIRFGKAEAKTNSRTGAQSKPFIFVDRNGRNNKMTFTSSAIEMLGLEGKRFFIVQDGDNWFIELTDDENGIELSFRKTRKQGYIYSKSLVDKISESLKSEKFRLMINTVPRPEDGFYPLIKI
jgi:hypothetical protein